MRLAQQFRALIAAGVVVETRQRDRVVIDCRMCDWHNERAIPTTHRSTSWHRAGAVEHSQRAHRAEHAAAVATEAERVRLAEVAP